VATAVVAHQTLIGPMTPADLRRAIELPAAKTGLLLQPGLVDTILKDLAGSPACCHCSRTRYLRHASAAG